MGSDIQKRTAIRSGMRRVNIKVSADVHEYFKSRAERTGVPMSSLMYLALEQAIEERELMRGLPSFVGAVQQAQLEAERAKRKS